MTAEAEALVLRGGEVGDTWCVGVTLIPPLDSEMIGSSPRSKAPKAAVDCESEEDCG